MLLQSSRFILPAQTTDAVYVSVVVGWVYEKHCRKLDSNRESSPTKHDTYLNPSDEGPGLLPNQHGFIMGNVLHPLRKVRQLAGFAEHSEL